MLLSKLELLSRSRNIGHLPALLSAVMISRIKAQNITANFYMQSKFYIKYYEVMLMAYE